MKIPLSRAKPIIITLRKQIKNEGVKFRRNPDVLWPKKNFQALRPLQNKLQSNLFMPPFTLDDEIKNDFEWLINFNVKDILPEIIDDGQWNKVENSAREKKKRQCALKEKTNTKGVSTIRNCKKNTQGNAKFTISPVIESIIEQCLLEKKSLSTKSICKWISEHYPSMKPRDRGSKNEIFMTLLKSNLFRIKKSARGKSGVWYLDRNTGDNQKLSATKQQPIQASTESTNKIKSSNKASVSVCCSPAKQYFSNYGTCNEKEIVPFPAENWLDTGFEVKDFIKVVKVEDPLESYEIEIPLANELFENESYYTSIDIPLLNEERCSFFP